MRASGTRRPTFAPVAAVVGSLGVVFGDIGTSPLYAVPAALRGQATELSPVVLGVTSSLVWTVLLVVAVLYVRLLLRTTNRGEGGLLALFSLLRSGLTGRRLTVVTLLAMVGTAAFLADGSITPAISVLSAVEGLRVLPGDQSSAIPVIAVVVLLGLFALQRVGAQRIGRYFGPVMVVWFLTLFVLGVSSVARTPSILVALSPHWAVLFFLEHPGDGLRSLGGVVLAVTGAEALYTGVGDFGRPAITRAWWFVVLPALCVNYLGQAAAVLRDPTGSITGLVMLVPHAAVVPFTVLATAAAVIASQAVISGSFSVVNQAGRLGLLPPLRARHTSDRRAQDVYLPVVATLLVVVVCALVLGFRTSAALADAYGIAVTVTMSVTCAFYLLLCQRAGARMRWQRWAGRLLMLVVLGLLVGNLRKVGSGGLLPIGTTLVLVLVMLVWRTGSHRVRTGVSAAPSIDRHVAVLLERGKEVRSTAAVVYLDAAGVSPAFDVLRQLTGSVPGTVILAAFDAVDAPFVDQENRTWVAPVAEGVVRLHCRTGYRQRMLLPDLIARARAEGVLTVPPVGELFYVASSLVPVAEPAAGLARYWQLAYAALARLESDHSEAFGLPRDRTLLIAREVPLSRRRPPPRGHRLPSEQAGNPAVSSASAPPGEGPSVRST